MLYFLRFKSSCYLVEPLQRWLRSFQRWSYKRTCHFITFYKALRLNLPSQAEKFTHPHITWLSSDISQCSGGVCSGVCDSWIVFMRLNLKRHTGCWIGMTGRGFTALRFEQSQHREEFHKSKHNNKTCYISCFIVSKMQAVHVALVHSSRLEKFLFMTS